MNFRIVFIIPIVDEMFGMVYTVVSHMILDVFKDYSFLTTNLRASDKSELTIFLMFFEVLFPHDFLASVGKIAAKPG